MIGKEILNYRIVALLGKGGMGSVYIAEHTLIRNEKVAIKVINANMANDFTRSLLREEAEHLAGLNHPNIVSFKNYHIDEEGNIYLIMEYVEGENLENFIRNVNGLIVEDRICAMFEPLLDAVGYAHKKHILHRDIKPANVVITPDGVPKILDFGIAKIIKNKNEEEDDSIVMGTPSYMSPEQVKGEHLDERSDIYSLGVLLHHMMTGNPPYDTTTLTEQQINMKVVEEPLPRMKTFYKYVSEGVQKVVDKATAKNPEDRFNSCDEFKKALHSAIYPPQMPKWVKIAAAAVVALLIGGGWMVWDYNRIKTYYYKDYTERWGIPEGIGELSTSEHSCISRSYKFVYQKRKLLNVSHVNSLDKLIDDGESERNERPVDQSFTYTADGKVSRVTVKDRSGKVLYVKSYNEKLNTMAFQYDDEHGTEKVISNSSVGYSRILEDNSDSRRGHISRWWIEYDDNGYATSVKYAGLDNSAIGDENGIYGRTYVRDDKGRPIEIHYIGIDGNPQPTRWGLGIKKFYYDDKDNWVKAEYLTIDRKPSLDDSDGICTYVMEYDDNGNIVYALHQDADGKLMLPRKNYIAGIHYTYDEQGLIIKEEVLGVDKKPMILKGQGFASIEFEYDENGYATKKTYLDTKGSPVNCTDGNSSITLKNDDKGNVLEQWYHDTNGKLCAISEGNAGVKVNYDSLGNVTKVIYYGVDKKPCLMKDQTAGYTSSYDDKNRVVSTLCIGVDMKPVANNNNIIMAQYEYDKRGNAIKITFSDETGKKLRLSDEGIAGWVDDYDENGNQTERRFFDTDGKAIMPVELQYARKTYSYDENGYLKSYRFYNLNGNLTLVDGIAGCNYVRDKKGNVLEETEIGTNNDLAPHKLKVKYIYDEHDNCIEQSLWNATDAAINSSNVHIYRYKYDSRNEIVEKSFYNTNGSLTLDADSKAAVIKYDYNDRGEQIKQQYFGTDRKPCVNYEGWSSSTYERDDFGNIIKQCFFGINGKPCDPKVMAPVGLAHYDKWGNMTYIAAQDGFGHFIIMPEKGWAINRMTYDSNGNRLSESYFDTKDKPMLSPEGYHKIVYAYDKINRQISSAYFNTNAQPMLVNNIHKYVYEYVGGTNKIKSESLYDTKGNKTNCDAGWQKIVYTYNDDLSLNTYKKFYKANGTVMKTLKWNGSEFVLVEAEFDWKTEVKNLNRELPINLGNDELKLIATSIKVTGTNSCEMTFTFPYSLNDISADQYSAVKQAINYMVELVEKDLKHKPYVYGTLYDKNKNKIYQYKK